MSRSSNARMNAAERRVTASMVGIYAVRLLGLFMILPVFALYAHELSGVTPLLMGMAIGAYGLTQALLQIPLGMLSDRIGRKPVIVGGLLAFVLGSVLAALSGSIYGVIAGRALQGTGAIAAAVMALAADLTREEQRTKVMAAIGLGVGLAFALALVAGPILDRWVGVPGIFWLTAIMGVVAIAIVVVVVPTPVAAKAQRDTLVVPAAVAEALRDWRLMRLDLGVFVLHMVLMADFVVLPLLLRDRAGLAAAQHWELYLPVLIVSFIAMLPFIVYAERYRQQRAVLLGATGLLALAELSFVYSAAHVDAIAVSLLMFFVAFNLLEANLPSMISKLSRADGKGTAMGVYSTSQFLGAFVGGTLGGALLQWGGADAVFVVGAAAVAVWLITLRDIENPRQLRGYQLHVGSVDKARARALADELAGIPGVTDAVVVPEDGLAYLKVDRDVLDEDRLHAFQASTA